MKSRSYIEYSTFILITVFRARRLNQFYKFPPTVHANRRTNFIFRDLCIKAFSNYKIISTCFPDSTQI